MFYFILPYAAALGLPNPNRTQGFRSKTLGQIMLMWLQVTMIFVTGLDYGNTDEKCVENTKLLYNDYFDTIRLGY